MSNVYEPMLSGQWTDVISTAEVTTTNNKISNNRNRDLAIASQKPREHPAPPPTSPTSPKVTKFCCCPQRRRFHLRQSPPKKSTLHARNIFIDNDFNYIDEVENISGNGSYTKTNNDQADNSKRTTKRPVPIYRKLSLVDYQLQLGEDKELKNFAIEQNYLESTKNNNNNKYNNNNDDYEDIQVNATNDDCINCGTGNCYTAELMNHKNCSGNNNSNNQWRHYKSALDKNTKASTENEQNIFICSDDENPITKTKETHNIESVDYTDASISITTNQILQQNQQQQKQEETQRHSCNEFFNKKQHSIKNNHRTDNKHNNNCFNYNCNNYREKNEHEGCNLSLAKENIPSKMTIATTINVASRKRGSECGSTTSTIGTTPNSNNSAIEMATTSSHAPQTTITTVIKTTMVKRSPSNEAASPPSTPPTTPTATDSNELVATCKKILNGDNKMTANASKNFDGKSNSCLRESTRTVRERIEALKANNEQSNNNNAIKYIRKNSLNDGVKNNNIQFNRQTNMTTNSVESNAIKSLHHNNNNSNMKSNKTVVISDTKTTAAESVVMPTTTTVITTPISTSTSINAAEKREKVVVNAVSEDIDDKQRHKSDCKSEEISTVTAPSNHHHYATSGNAATMPRRRCNNNNNNNITNNDNNNHMNNNHNGNVGIYGSNSEAMTNIDKKFLSQTLKPQKVVVDNVNVVGAVDKKLSSSSSASSSYSNGSCHKYTALDNLDLALNLDLSDDDGEDPYYVLQEYLERVKREINEVFELHKARQRMQQQQQNVEEQQQEQQNYGVVEEQEQQQALVQVTNETTTSTGATTNDELSRSTESDSGFDSATGGRLGSSRRNIHNNNNNNNKWSLNEETDQVTEISCHSDVNEYVEPSYNQTQTGNGNEINEKEHSSGEVVENSRVSSLAPLNLSAGSDNSITGSTSSSSATLKRLRDQFAAKSAANSDDVNIWANKFLRDLDNLMASSDKCSTTSSLTSSPTCASSPILLSAAASAAIQSRYGKNNAIDREHNNTNGLLLRSDKHLTIPSQSFNLDCNRQYDIGSNNSSSGSVGLNGGNASQPQVVYMRTLSAPTPGTTKNMLPISNRQYLAATEDPQHNRNLINTQTRKGSCGDTKSFAEPMTIYKIEETAQVASEQQQQQQQQQQDILSCEGIGEDVKLINTRQQCQLLENDMEAIHNSLLTHEHQQKEQQQQIKLRNNSSCCNKNMLVASGTATSIPKRERINHATTTLQQQLQKNQQKVVNSTNNNCISSATTMLMKNAATTTANNKSNGSNYLLNGIDTTKKGSTSTIWTSEESILRSVGAVDEDNNSTSSSACEEASGVLSSGKSGVSLDSSGLDNDNNESGIGTATPPKEMSYWKNAHHNHNDNESLSSLDVVRKIQFQKSSSVASSDDPDLLEVLSLCENEIAEAEVDDDDTEDVDADVDDEGHDEFQTVSYCDCGEFTDGDVSNASGKSNATALKRININRKGFCMKQKTNGDLSASGVVLRRKYVKPIFMQQTCRSYSLDPQQHLVHNQNSQLSRILHNLQHTPRSKERVQLSLALKQEPFQSLLPPTHFQELPSPSTASLHSGHEGLGIQELTTKSNSAPLLLKQEKRHDDFAGQKLTLRYSRSQSDRYLAEIEAVEACKWLRAAGFPQYAQMYEDHQFPIDLTNVAKDHTNLENDQLQSLYRRLCVLNRCANMRIDQSHKTQTPQKEDSDDENFALSENWTFQRHIRRWSRIGEMGIEAPPAGKANADKTESSSKESSPDRFEDDNYDVTGASLSLTLPGEQTDASGQENGESTAVRLRRTGSERLKDGAKAFLRRVESIKSRRRKRQNREGVVISGPQTLDLAHFGHRNSLRKPDAVYSTPPSPSALSPVHTFPKSTLFGNELKVPSQSENYLSPNRMSPKRTPTTPRSVRTSPLHFFTQPMPHLKEGKSDDSSSYYSDSQESSAGVNKNNIRKIPSKTRRFLQARTGKVDDIGPHSDSECHHGRKLLIKDANSNTTEVKIKKLQRGGSLNLGKDGKRREGFRTASFRSRSTNRKEIKTEETDHIKNRSPVVRWHSFQMEERPNMIFRKCFTQCIERKIDSGLSFHAMSAGQLQILRKLALVILTGYMERYCPTHRSGWNWELPKFIKKIKMPDYKDKRVFGVPLLLILQRSGQTLPIAIRAAFRWLQLNALDQIGLFRKSGVKSRIQKLKELIEYSDNGTECMDIFDTQQAYDVADMVKQFFRDLPESLLTTKMSETFVAIFQHLPADVRLDAVQCAVLLIPDENREILYALLEFLTLVAANSQYNQMTANNLAVCLAPSLFHSSIPTGSNSVQASPRRRGKGSGVPDVKELSEAKASHECLAFMIENYKQIFTATKDKINKCNFGYMEESKPVPLEALGEGMQFHNWRGYLYECTTATIKEGREKTRGWFTINSVGDPHVEIAYKKVGDGHPLRLWRCITEVDGQPKETLQYIINQRAHWDPNLLQSQTIKRLDDRTEIFQYTLDGQFTTDFCVLRAWQTDLPRGACVIVETSIDHSSAKPMYGAVRGVVLASRYLIEPCGSGRSRVMHLARVDIKGKTPEWYNKSYGHICSHFLSRIRKAFKHVTEKSESKV